MPLRSSADRIVFSVLALLLLAVAPARAADFIDSAGRHVVLPDRIGRIMAAGPPAAVLVLALTPDRLIGWPHALAPDDRRYLPARAASLPVTGRLTGAHPTADAGTVRRLRPDLIVDAGSVTPAYAALADRIQQQTGVPYILLDDSIERTPGLLRTLGAALGVKDRGEDLATFAGHAIAALRGDLLTQPSDKRPRLYYGRGADGLSPGLLGFASGETIAEAGAINVAVEPAGARGGAVTPAQVLAWNPDIIIAQERSFYDALRRDPQWRNLAAVREHRIYRAPSQPFGWIDEPPGINRIIGLYWLSALLYPEGSQEDLRTIVGDFYTKFYGVKLTAAQIEALVRPAEAQPGELRRSAGSSLLGSDTGYAMPAPTTTGGEPGRHPAPGGAAMQARPPASLQR